jgi:beta-lactamase class A
MWKRAAGLAVLAGGMLSFSVGYAFADAHATEGPLKVLASASPTANAQPSSPGAKPSSDPPPSSDPSPASDTPPPPSPDPTPTPAPVHPSFDSLASVVNAIIASSGGQVEVSLIELGGPAASSWQVGDSVPMDAASDYKLPALMEEAQLVAAGRIDPNGLVCYQDADYEDGWFDDYSAGACFTRNELADRAGHYSDNTAGHMLVRDLGGSAALNVYAAGLGAQNSDFFDVNQTTAGDLARMMAAEATGAVGGAAAQAWLYPRLTNTHWEAGIPAGVPAGTSVVHKTGALDGEVNDAAIVSGGKSGTYVLAVMTDGSGGDAAWGLVAQISTAVWAYEATR